MPRETSFRILPGMAVTVELDLAGGSENLEEGKFLVPSTAIRTEGSSSYVWRYAVGQVSRVPVNVGQIRSDALVEIEGDTLSGGDVIVTAGAYFLHEGQKVRLTED